MHFATVPSVFDKTKLACMSPTYDIKTAYLYRQVREPLFLSLNRLVCALDLLLHCAHGLSNVFRG